MNPENNDPAFFVGHVASVSAIVATWMGLLAPLAAFFASCMAIAWYCALFYDRHFKAKK